MLRGLAALAQPRKSRSAAATCSPASQGAKWPTSGSSDDRQIVDQPIESSSCIGSMAVILHSPDDSVGT
jgi:hypothetical protein